MPDVIGETVATALGREHRDDPVLPNTGGPAGNANLTAWLGLILLTLFLVELMTLISMSSLLGVHIFVGAFLVPVILVKTATTGWRMARYYLRSDHYVRAGPPPALLRILGPMVVIGALAVVGTGLSLIALGNAAHSTLFTVLGFRVDAITLHQAAFIAWAVTTGLHLLGRFVPALRLSVPPTPSAGSSAPGLASRLTLIVLTTGVAVLTGLLILEASHSWTS
ncbi:MAG: hypothetical protein JO246_09905 [Frankiaceae bacterium]|nr:hypothetical protein [Frankiaceae bacterium]MBV9870104.1 hypothetical protein [Frankiaceae bacterium]